MEGYDDESYVAPAVPQAGIVRPQPTIAQAIADARKTYIDQEVKELRLRATSVAFSGSPEVNMDVHHDESVNRAFMAVVEAEGGATIRREMTCCCFCFPLERFVIELKPPAPAAAAAPNGTADAL
jgi:hypothetical protein